MEAYAAAPRYRHYHKRGAAPDQYGGGAAGVLYAKEAKEQADPQAFILAVNAFL